MSFDLQLEAETLDNTDYRRVIYSVPPMKPKFDGAPVLSSGLQLVLMFMKEGQRIELEIHEKSDQFIRVEKGLLEVICFNNNSSDTNTSISKIGDGDAVIIPKLTVHTVIALKNTKFYTIYTSNEHRPDEVEHEQIIK